jgi:hypothetical protein
MIPSSPSSQGNVSSLIGDFLGNSSQSATLSSVSSEEAMAILTSRKFTENFIIEKSLMPILFADQWNNESKKWIGNEVSVREGYELISGALKIGYSKNLILLGFTWHEPENSAYILNNLIIYLNSYLRKEAILESKKSITYLIKAQADTSLSGPKIMINSILENELYTSMLVNISEEYAFKIIDPANVPISAAGPNRKLIVILGIILGIFLSIFIIILKNFFMKKESD